MGSKIPWTDKGLDLVGGCTKVSAGCRYCYAAKLVGSRLANNPVCKGRYSGLAFKDEEQFNDYNWTGEIKLFEDRLENPLHWRQPCKIFICPYSDLFHKDVPEWFIAKVFDVIRRCNYGNGGRPGHTFQILTKRPERAAEMLPRLCFDHTGEGRVWFAEPGLEPKVPLTCILPNLWFGTTVENQEMADKRIPHLLRTPAAKRFVSVEPILGPVDLKLNRWVCLECGDWTAGEILDDNNHCRCDIYIEDRIKNELDWVIIGPENGPGKRPFDVDWAYKIVHDCDAAGVPVFIKPSKWFEWPEDLKDRQEYPAV